MSKIVTSGNKPALRLVEPIPATPRKEMPPRSCQAVSGNIRAFVEMHFNEMPEWVGNRLLAMCDEQDKAINVLMFEVSLALKKGGE